MAQSPLHDIFDPYGTATGRNGKDPTIEDLMPEEEKSALLHYLSNLGSNGIAGAGWLLDTPGAVVRGLLSGGPLKALSALGETTEDRVTGRELARQHGLIGDEDNWGNFFGGVGAEMLLDPLTYFGAGLIGHGAKTVGGGILKKSGAMKWMPSTLMERNADAIASGGSRVGPREFARKTTVGDFVDMLPPEVAGSHKAQLMLLAKEHAAKPLSTVERLLGQKRLTAQELLNSPISKMNRVSIPGLETGSADLFGERFSDAASKALDAAGESMQTMPGIGKAVRTVNAAFVPGYGDELDLADQRARYVGEARRQAALVPKSFAHNKAVYDAQAEHLAEMANWKATHESTVASLRAEQDAIEAAIRAGGPLPPNTMGRRYDIRKELERQADLALSGGPVGMNEPEYIRAFNNAATGGNEVWGDIPVPNHSPTILGVHSPEQIAANTSDAKLRLAMQMLDPQGAPNAQKALVKHQLDTLELARIKQKQLALDVNESSSRHSRPTAEILYGPREKLFFDNPQAAPPSPGSLPTSAKEQVLVSGGRQVTPLSDQHSMARGHHMDVLGGDEVLNAMSRDAKLQDALRAAASHDVPGIFHKWMSERYAPWLARSTNASPGNPLYGWLDDLDAMGEFKHSVPDGAVNMSNTPEGIALSNINSKISRVPEEQLAKTGASIGTPKELQELIANLSMAGAIKDPERLFHTNLLNKHYGTLLQDQNAAQLAFDTAKRGAYMGKMYDDLANTYRTLDPQHAKTGIPIFGVHPANSLDNYQRSRSTLESSARMLLDKMISKAVVSPGLASVPAVDRVIGGTHYSLLQAANELGFDPQQFEKLVLNEFPSAKTANDISIPKSAVDPLTKRLRKASPRPELQYVRDALDRYTKSFKTLALLSPSVSAGIFSRRAKIRPATTTPRKPP